MENTEVNVSVEANETKPRKKRHEWTGSDLKILAIIVMFIDHFAAVVLESKLVYLGMNDIVTLEDQIAFMAQNGRLYAVYIIMRLIGRLGFPIFCFLLVEGFYHTRNKWKYLRNLAIFALVSELPFNLAISHTILSNYYQNVFFTLGLGLLALIFVDKALHKENYSKPLSVLGLIVFLSAGATALHFVSSTEILGGSLADYAATSGKDINDVLSITSISFWLTGVGIGLGMLIITALIIKKSSLEKLAGIGYALLAVSIAYFAAELLYTDYAGGGILTIAAIYVFKRKSNVKSAVAGCVVLTLMQLIEGTAFLILLPIKRYNGKRGISLKYFFYAFYPVHLFLLYALTIILGYNSLPW